MENGHLVSTVFQSLDHVRTDEPAAADDENAHRVQSIAA
jgi:hypothetical protein